MILLEGILLKSSHLRNDPWEMESLMQHISLTIVCSIPWLYYLDGSPLSSVLISWFNGISIFVCYSMPKLSLKKNNSGTIGDFGTVEGSCQNSCVKGSAAPTRPTPVCYNLSVRRMSTVSFNPHRRHHQEEGRRRT